MYYFNNIFGKNQKYFKLLTPLIAISKPVFKSTTEINL